MRARTRPVDGPFDRRDLDGRDLDGHDLDRRDLDRLDLAPGRRAPGWPTTGEREEPRSWSGGRRRCVASTAPLALVRQRPDRRRGARLSTKSDFLAGAGQTPAHGLEKR